MIQPTDDPRQAALRKSAEALVAQGMNAETVILVLAVDLKTDTSCVLASGQPLGSHYLEDLGALAPMMVAGLADVTPEIQYPGSEG